MNIGDCYALQKKHKKALVNYNQAYYELKNMFGPKHQMIASLCNNMVVNWFNLNEPDSATLYAQKSLHANLLDFDNMDIHATPPLDSMHYIDGMEVLYALANKAVGFQGMYNMTTKNEADLNRAFETIKTTFKLFERLEFNSKSAQDKMLLSKNMQATFLDGLQICNQLHELTGDKLYMEQAIAFSEITKGALLRQAIQEDNAQTFGGIPDSILQLELEIKKNLAEYENQWVKAKITADKKSTLEIREKIFEERERFFQLEEQFQKEYKEYYLLKYNNNSPKINELQAALKPNEVLISYSWHKKNFFAIVIQKDSVKLVEQKTASLNAKVDSLLDLLHSSKSALENLEAFSETYSLVAYDLYEFLIKNIHLPQTAKELIIIPDGALYYVPFEALIDRPIKETESLKDLNYLVKKYSIRYLYSATLFQQLSQRTTISNNKMLAFAPTYSPGLLKDNHNAPKKAKIRNKLIPLEGAQQEVKALEVIFEGEFLYGNDASELNFNEKASDFGILHFAMHGLLDKSAPTNSSLAFTGTNDSIQDDFVHAYEINNLNLNAQLVVLSACETGHGKFESGEGVMSLARSFMYAGANSVIATLWQVNDASTAMLMAYFYENLANKMPKAQALRQAKLDYLEIVKNNIPSHPNFWAAPILIGDNRTLNIQKRSNLLPWIGAIVGLLVLLLLINKFRNRAA